MVFWNGLAALAFNAWPLCVCVLGIIRNYLPEVFFIANKGIYRNPRDVFLSNTVKVY